MGTFAHIFKGKGCIIPESNREELTSKVEKVFRSGGMMDMEWINLCGKSIQTIHKVSMQEKGMNVCYNYFEDDFWENAGYDRKECCVWSNKIGWSHFHSTIVAAYVLEELYTDGVSITMVDGDPVTSWAYVGWLNYLFGEKNHIKNFDPWKVFEEIHYSLDESEECIEWHDTGDRRYAFIGGCEICAVRNGYEEALDIYNSKEKGILEKFALNEMLSFVEKLNHYMENCGQDKKSQLQMLMKMIRIYYETDELSIDKLYDKDEMLNPILTAMACSDAPAFAVKVISEMYEVDFWELWIQIRDVVRRKMVAAYGNGEYYVLPISTETFFKQSPDDMIIYWEEGCGLEFSKELQDWFEKLRIQYNNILCEEFTIDNVLSYVVGLLEEVNDNYYNIYAFSNFFEETLENLKDKRYQTVWRMFDNMIHDPDMIEAGNVIFVPDGLKHEKEGLYYLGEQPKRRLLGSWCFMEPHKKYNKARVTFRRYMALLGNNELRSRVLGF